MKRIVLVAITLLPLTGCLSVGDGDIMPLPIPIGGSVARPAPSSKPILPAIFTAQEPTTEQPYEQHGVADPNDCTDMEKRFQQEGRKVNLVDVVKNGFNRGGGILEFLCLFDGEDAEPENNSAFEDYRYNSPEEYVYP